MQRFKFNRNMACGIVLAEELAGCLVGSYTAENTVLPDALVPVPLPRLRHAARSFNQADVVARHLGLPAAEVVV